MGLSVYVFFVACGDPYGPLGIGSCGWSSWLAGLGMALCPHEERFSKMMVSPNFVLWSREGRQYLSGLPGVIGVWQILVSMRTGSDFLSEVGGQPRMCGFPGKAVSQGGVL